MKNKVSVVTFILLFIIILICFAMFVPQNDKNLAMSQMQYESIIGYDLDESYPQNPYDVMTINNEIMTFLYGGSIRDEQMETVVTMQRKLFHPKLLELNTLDSQIAKTLEEITRLKENKFRIISITHKPPIYDEFNPNACVIEVTQYSNMNSNLLVDYYVVKDDDKNWKILGWVSNTVQEEASDAQ